jgi:hypothetical protein
VYHTSPDSINDKHYDILKTYFPPAQVSPFVRNINTTKHIKMMTPAGKNSPGLPNSTVNVMPQQNMKS